MLFTLTKGFHGSEWVLELTASTSDRSPGSQWQTDLWTMHSIKSFFKHKSSSPPKVGGAGDGDDTPRPCTSSSGCSAQSDPDSSDSVSPPVTELRSMYSAFSDSDKSGFDRERVPQLVAAWHLVPNQKKGKQLLYLKRDQSQGSILKHCATIRKTLFKAFFVSLNKKLVLTDRPYD